MDKHSALMEKVSTLGMTALFALAMIVLGIMTLFGGKDGYLGPLTVIAPWIQVTVLGAGIVLLMLLGIQLAATALGIESGHTHAHFEDRTLPDGKGGQEPGQCNHEHEPGHVHEHEHEHKHEHDHNQEHGHDHAWSPVRYIPLVVPLLLVAMGMPSSDMIKAYEQDLIHSMTSDLGPFAAREAPGDSLRRVTVAALAFGPLADTTGLTFAMGEVVDILDEDPDAAPVVTDLAELERVCADPFLRDQWSKYRSVEVQGMFNPGEISETGIHVFSVVQLRIACCLGDARPAFMFAGSRKEPGVPPGHWVAVRGRLDFLQSPQGFKPAMRVFKVEKRTTPARPYLTR
jgi:hypothetical protein